MYVLDAIVTLVDFTIEVNQKTLQERKVEITKTIFASLNSIGYREFYESKRNDFDLSFKVIVSTAEYSKERYLIHNQQKYVIVRTYKIDDDFVELTCERIRHQT